MSDKNQSVSLVLGSGGARGLAHIGVIHWIEEDDYDIRSISGCSMGALIGGVFACGKLDIFEKWVRAISKIDIVRLLDVSWGKQGLVIRSSSEQPAERRFWIPMFHRELVNDGVDV